MTQRITRRSFVRTTGIAAGLIPLIPSMSALARDREAGTKPGIPQIPYGAVYFRKSNPPREDWEQDYKTASEDGINTFRHWFIWSAIETSPGVYDWKDYDRQLELAAKYGIRTVIAEMSALVPQWVFDRYPEILYVDDKGRRPVSGISPATATGGHAKGNAGAICMNTKAGRELIGSFLEALAERYKGHPSLMAYDVWNECFYPPDICFHEATRLAFIKWLKEKYDSLDELRKAWRRFSIGEWKQVQIPKSTWPWPECQDWVYFRKDNFYDHMQWKVDLLRGVDPDVRMTAHGIGNSINWVFSHGSDHWEAASHVESYGFTFVQSRERNDPITQWHSVDLVRAGSRGKPFWHSEAQAGPYWFGSAKGRKKEDGRIADPEDVRIWNMITLAAGGRGILYPRWRPLLDGPLHGAFGPYSMDGSRNKRSAEMSRVAKWANDPASKSLFEAQPVKGDVGILFMHETASHSYLSRSTAGGDWYPQALWGACRGFINNNLQADWVHPDDMDRYEVLYLPYPVAITGQHANLIKEWVRKGGTLISEGCPGYFGGNLRVGETQPNLGLDELFGAVETNVEFMPDIDSPFRLEGIESAFKGGGYKQGYRLKKGSAMAWYEDGSVAAVSHRFGKGRTLLVGTHPSIHCHRVKGGTNTGYFREIFRFTKREQLVGSSNPAIQARLHRKDKNYFLWIVNPTREAQETGIKISDALGKIKFTASHWNEYHIEMAENRFTAQVPARDVLILEFES